MAWGERDGPGEAILWIREDVPLLLWIAIGSLIAAAVLLVVGGRRMRKVAGQPEAAGGH